MKKLLKNNLVLILVFFAFANNVYANIGLPMIIIAWPIFWLLLIPVIIIEWIILKKKLGDFSSKHLFYAALLSNFLSTLAGIPLAWGCMLCLQFLIPGGLGTFPSFNDFWRYFLGATVQAAWLIPYEDQFYWMIPTAFIVLLIPFFLVSYWVEAFTTLTFLNPSIDRTNIVKKAVWDANIYSYGFLFITSIIYLLYQIITH